jgi:hypothetical protein
MQTLVTLLQFQVLKSYMWITAAVLDTEAVSRSSLQNILLDSSVL